MYELTERAKRYHEDEVTALQKYSKEIGEKLREITIGYENENAKRIEVQEQNKDYRNSIDKLRIQVILILTYNLDCYSMFSC